MSQFKNHLRDLEVVSNIKCNETKIALLKYLSNDPRIFKALKEIALNIIEGHMTIDKKTKKKLSKHKEIIYAICNKSKVSAKDRKKLVVQSGGWLWILPIVSSIIDLIE